jgi:hypothetical protein
MDCLANRLEGRHVPLLPFRSPPPRSKPARPLGPLNRTWSDLPAPRRQEALLVLSHIIAKSLRTPVRKEAGREHR